MLKKVDQQISLVEYSRLLRSEYDYLYKLAWCPFASELIRGRVTNDMLILERHEIGDVGQAYDMWQADYTCVQNAIQRMLYVQDSFTTRSVKSRS